MTSLGLKPSVELRGEGERAELFDAATKRTLALSALEAKLLALWDGLASAMHLTDLARAQGVVIEPRQASIFFERLERAGFLAAAPASDSGLVPDAPGLEHLDDRVPKLRGDLLIGRAPGAKGVLQVTDPLKSRSFTLYDFEVSIARLLDGRRTAGQLLEAAGRLGIPVNLESLRKFIRQLRGYHFIDEAAVAPASPPPVRVTPETWTPQLRELYDSAVRFARLGKLDRALEYLEALLEINAALEEPRELKARLEAQRAGEVEVDVNFDSLHGVPNPLAAPPPLPAMDFMTLHASPPTTSAAPPALPTGGAPADSPSSPLSAASPPRPAPAAPPSRPAPLPSASPPRPASAPASPPRPEAPSVAVNFSTPSALLRHDEDPFQLYAPGVVIAPKPAAPPASTPSIIIEEDPGPAGRVGLDPGSSSSVIAAFTAMGAAGAAAQAAHAPPAPPSPAAKPEAPRASVEGGAGAPFGAVTPDAPRGSTPEAVAPHADKASEAPAEPGPDAPVRPVSSGDRRRWLARGLLAVGGVLVLALVAGAAWLLRSVPRHESLACTLEPLDAVTVTAPWAGALAPPAVESGARATAGQTFGGMDVTAAKARLSAIAAQRAELERRRATLKRGRDKAIKAAAKKRDAARKARADIDTKLERAKALPPAQQKSKVPLLQKFVVLTQKRLDAAEAALEKLTHEQQLAQLAAEETALEAERASLDGQLASAALVAPVAGRVTWLVKPGEAVEAGAPVAKVDAGRWRVRAEATVKLPAGVPVEATVVTGGRTLEVRRLDVQPAAVLGVVDSATPLSPTGTLELAAGERHAYELLFGDE